MTAGEVHHDREYDRAMEELDRAGVERDRALDVRVRMLCHEVYALRSRTATDLMTAEEVAAYLRVPIATLYQWRHRGEGPRAARIGRHLRYRRADVDAYFEGAAAVEAGGTR